MTNISESIVNIDASSVYYRDLKCPLERNCR